jgi:hypothetical protein
LARLQAAGEAEKAAKALQHFSTISSNSSNSNSNSNILPRLFSSILRRQFSSLAGLQGLEVAAQGGVEEANLRTRSPSAVLREVARLQS